MYTRLAALQNWALFWNAAQKICGAIFAGSTSGRTIAGSLPPSSSVTRLSVPAAARITCLPVSVLPVKAIFAIPGCAVIHFPSSSSPLTALNTPGGRRSCTRSTSLRSHRGVKGEGLTMMVLPATSAGAIFHTANRIGKFHGTIAPTTPRGVCRLITLRSAVSSRTSSGRDCLAISRNHATEPYTSHSAIGRGLPCSAVNSARNSSAWASSRSPIAETMAWRSASGVADHPANAASAAATASSSWAEVATGTSAITSVVAGLYTGAVSCEVTDRPPIVIGNSAGRTRASASVDNIHLLQVRSSTGCETASTRCRPNRRMCRTGHQRDRGVASSPARSGGY